MVTVPTWIEAVEADATPHHPAQPAHGMRCARYCAGFLVAYAFAFLISMAALMVLEVRSAAASQPAKSEDSFTQATSATILVYHRFGPTVPDPMTVRTSVFEYQVHFLRENGYTVVPLRDIVNFVMGRGQLPPQAVAITVDDGHRTVFSAMRPVVLRYRIPVTLFIYPSAISHAPYAMTWAQLQELKSTGLFEIQSHTYWHPNFHTEKTRRPADDYREFIAWQLSRSRKALENRLTGSINLLAWPYGIYDDELISAARTAGYVAGFTLERRQAKRTDNVMAIPRFIVSDSDQGKAFEVLLNREADIATSLGVKHTSARRSKPQY